MDKDEERYKYPKIRLGLCCSVLSLRFKYDVYSSRRLNLATIVKKGLKWAENVAKENLIDLLKMSFWSKNRGIDVTRISSELVPHGNNIELVRYFGNKAVDYISLEFLRPYLEIVGRVARLEGIRMTFHPGQFVQIGAPNEDVFLASVRELEMHATFLDMMKMGSDSVIVVHIGGMYGDKKGSIRRFIKQFGKLPKKVKRRLVLENDEKCYDADEVLEISKRVKRPMVFDYHHYVCYKKYHPEKEQMTFDKLIPEVLETWNIGGERVRPKFHLSEQMEGKPVGSHSLLVEEIPEVFLDIPERYGVDIDIMIEAKGKEVAISKLFQKYPALKQKYVKDLPKRFPKDALKDLKLPPEIKEEVECEC